MGRNFGVEPDNFRTTGAVWQPSSETRKAPVLVAGAGRKRAIQGHLPLDSVGSVALFSLEGLHLELQALAERTGDEAADAVCLPLGFVHEFLQGCALGTFEQPDN